MNISYPTKLNFKAMPLEFYTSKGLERGQFYREDGSILNVAATTYARSDIDWKALGKFLKSNFQSCNEFNTYVFACSKGDEAYTVSMLLRSIYGNNNIEIKALDINSNTIKEAKNNQENGIRLTKSTVKNIREELNLSKSNQKECFKYLFLEGDFILKDELRRSVEFKKGNILTSLDEIDKSKPVLIFARNMWPYVHHREYKDFCKELFNKLPEHSVFVIGYFDKNGLNNYPYSKIFPLELYNTGFVNPKEIDNSRTKELIFQKPCK